MMSDKVLSRHHCSHTFKRSHGCFSESRQRFFMPRPHISPSPLMDMFWGFVLFLVGGGVGIQHNILASSDLHFHHARRARGRLWKSP